MRRRRRRRSSSSSSNTRGPLSRWVNDAVELAVPVCVCWRRARCAAGVVVFAFRVLIVLRNESCVVLGTGVFLWPTY